MMWRSTSSPLCFPHDPPFHPARNEHHPWRFDLIGAIACYQNVIVGKSRKWHERWIKPARLDSQNPAGRAAAGK